MIEKALSTKFLETFRKNLLEFFRFIHKFAAPDVKVMNIICRQNSTYFDLRTGPLINLSIAHVKTKPVGILKLEKCYRTMKNVGDCLTYDNEIGQWIRAWTCGPRIVKIHYR